MRSVTPGWPLSPVIRDFCRRLSHRRPMLLGYTPVDPVHQVKESHFNAWHAVRARGGAARRGWVIWEARLGGDRLVHASYHSVWHPPGAGPHELLDITPREDGAEHEVFVPDPTREIETFMHGGREHDLAWSDRTSIAHMPYLGGDHERLGLVFSMEKRTALMAAFGFVCGQHTLSDVARG